MEPEVSFCKNKNSSHLTSREFWKENFVYILALDNTALFFTLIWHFNCSAGFLLNYRKGLNKTYNYKYNYFIRYYFVGYLGYIHGILLDTKKSLNINNILKQKTNLIWPLLKPFIIIICLVIVNLQRKLCEHFRHFFFGINYTNVHTDG